MKRLSIVVAALMLLLSSSAFAAKVKADDFPEKGWHKGFYIAGDAGIMQATNDGHTVYKRDFNGKTDIAFGLTFGWDIADWIGPMVQMTYATATSQVGDQNNVGQPVTYNGITYGADTFPIENAREHVLDFGIFARATLPYFTRASWQPKMIKILPYMKLGGVGHALFVNAPTHANKTGAFGGGPAIGAGLELFIWKGFFVSLDFTESFIIQKNYYIDIDDSVGQSHSVKVTDGGFKPQAMFLGLVGWHF